jgi:ATP-dependent protease ClpP protease subunit
MASKKITQTVALKTGGFHPVVTEPSEMQQLVYDVHNFSINYNTREIYLHGTTAKDDDVEPGVEYRMATTFIKNLNILESQNNDNILIRMHTVGGNWTDGMAIFNSIALSPVKSVMLAYAQASSMSGIILQAAHRRIMMPDTEYMIHHGSIYIENNSIAARSQIEMNNRSCRRMLEIFANRAKTGKFFKDRAYNDKQIIDFFNRKLKDKGDWYLDAEEALYYGLCDGVFGDKGFETIEKIRNFSKSRLFGSK